MPDERTFRIQWAYGRTDDVTGDISDAIRQAQATIEAGGEDFEWYDPLVIVDLTTGREFHIPDAVLRLPVETAARIIGKMEDAAVGGTRLVDLQAIRTARTGILRHLEGFGDADLRQAAALLADVAKRAESAAQVATPVATLTGIDRRARADLVTARGTLRRIAGGNEADPDTAASMIDRVLATVCPHDASEHHTAPDVMDGRPLTTCYGCGVTWYADYPERLAHVTSYVGDEGE